MINEILKAQREFVSRMYGIVPNRVMLNYADFEKLKDDVRSMALYTQVDENLPVHRWIISGMRVVVDEWAVGIEVGYVR